MSPSVDFSSTLDEVTALRGWFSSALDQKVCLVNRTLARSGRPSALGAMIKMSLSPAERVTDKQVNWKEEKWM